MSLLTELLNDIKKCCCPFLVSPEPEPTANLSEPLIEMATIQRNPINNDLSPLRNRKKSASCKDVHSDNK